MRCIDFEYDGQLLSDHDCVICNIGNSPGVETTDFGNHVSLNTVYSIGTNKFHISSTGYDEPYTVSFQVAKLCHDMKSASQIGEYELSDMMRWLNRKNYCKFKPIYKDGECSDVYYMGTFDVQPIDLCGRIIGLDLTLKTNAPFGYYEPVSVYMDLKNVEDTYTLINSSDETGLTYPTTVTIECLSDGDLILKNSKDGRYTEVKKCKAGEVLTLNGEEKQISSSMSHKKLYNDFNYNFVRIYSGRENGMDNNDNVFSSTLPCNVSLVYSPICKRGVI